MKKKIVSLCAVAALALTAIAGSTIAYFTDKDAANNVFTYGNVDITLQETFDKDKAKLIPVVYNEDGTKENVIPKEVKVENNGSEDAFVRVHIAIPTAAEDAKNPEQAIKNLVHFNYPADSLNDWAWSADKDENTFDFYRATIDGVGYNVYVVTYKTALAAGEVTKTAAMNQVYMDKNATNEQIEALKAATNNSFQIKVVAEAAQAQGFVDAFAALNTAFGIPGTYDAFAAN